MWWGNTWEPMIILVMKMISPDSTEGSTRQSESQNPRVALLKVMKPKLLWRECSPGMLLGIILG